MNKLGKILVVDDDSLVLEAMHQTFLDEYDVITAASGEEGLAALEKYRDVNCIVLDIRMARMDGLETAGAIRRRWPEIPVIFHTGFPGDYSEQEVEQEHRPFDYITKDERPERIIRAVRNAVSFHRLCIDSHQLAEQARREYGLVGCSRVMRRVYEIIERLGPTDSKVMILGPTGSGKELVARALHNRSRRADKHLAIFNCNHKAPDLVESELFGHLKGSFTSAVRDQIGVVEYADGGTLFLDEIGNLDPTTQEKLLRVLESGEMLRMGSPELIKVDIRVICATNSNLEEMVAAGCFREDPYYRLRGVPIVLPALKEKREDIPELIDYFTDSYCRTRGIPLRVFEREALNLLIEFDWPGNVRQLGDTIQSLVDLSPSELITRSEVADLLRFEGPGAPARGRYRDRLREYKKIMLIQALAEHDGNAAAAARALDIDQSNFRKMLRDLDLA